MGTQCQIEASASEDANFDRFARFQTFMQRAIKQESGDARESGVVLREAVNMQMAEYFHNVIVDFRQHR